MANFTVTGYKSPGQTFTVTNATAPAVTDTITLNGVKQTIKEWVRCGVFKFKSTVSTTHTYHISADAAIRGYQASGANGNSNEVAPEFSNTTVDVTVDGTDTLKVYADVTGKLGYKIGTISWGDSTANSAYSGTTVNHTYDAAGDYTITFTGSDGFSSGTAEVSVVAGV